MAVAADGQSPTFSQVLVRAEKSISEVRFGRGTDADHCAALGQPNAFIIVHLCRVNNAPVFIDFKFVEQQFNRPSPGRGDAVVNFPSLFGGVNMDGAAWHRLTH